MSLAAWRRRQKSALLERQLLMRTVPDGVDPVGDYIADLGRELDFQRFYGIPRPRTEALQREERRLYDAARRLRT